MNSQSVSEIKYIGSLKASSGYRLHTLIKRDLPVLMFSVLIFGFSCMQVPAQGGRTLFGDVKIDLSKADVNTTPNITVVLYRDVGGEVGRQPVANKSRYRFTNLVSGDYVIAVEVNNTEVARMPITIAGLSNSPYGFQQDLEFAWKPGANASARPSIISAADAYDRPSANKGLFQKAQDAAEKKKFDQAAAFLQQIVTSDSLDFQAWTLLGTVYVVQNKPAEAEKAYLSAIKAKPNFALALLDLGRLLSNQKRFEPAVEQLTLAVQNQPKNAEANFLLGEAYLQLKKGSKAVGYLEEAGRLGRPEAYLRVAWLYNAAGLKDKAAAEYEAFLKAKPDYAEKQKLEEYIKANKQP